MLPKSGCVKPAARGEDVKAAAIGCPGREDAFLSIAAQQNPEQSGGVKSSSRAYFRASYLVSLSSLRCFMTPQIYKATNCHILMFVVTLFL